MKFRIFDLIFLTTLIAMFIAAFQKDVTFFRQFLCFCLITLGSTLAVLFFPRVSRRPWKLGAVGGLVGGLIYLFVAYFFVFLFYEPMPFVRSWIASDSVYYTWQTEALPVMVIAGFFGSAIGPLVALRIRKPEIPSEFRRPIWFSIGLLLGMFLIGLLAMQDRFAAFGDVRQILPLMVLALVVFVIHTHSWMNRLASGLKAESESKTAETDPPELLQQAPKGHS